MGPSRRPPLRRVDTRARLDASPQRPGRAPDVRGLRGAEALDGGDVEHSAVAVVRAHEGQRPAVLGARLPAAHRVPVVDLRRLDASRGARRRGAHHEQGVGDARVQAGDASDRDRVRPRVHAPGDDRLRPGLLRRGTRRQRQQDDLGHRAHPPRPRAHPRRPRTLPVQQLVPRSHHLRRRRDRARPKRPGVRPVHGGAVPQADVALPRSGVLRAPPRRLPPTRTRRREKSTRRGGQARRRGGLNRRPPPRAVLRRGRRGRYRRRRGAHEAGAV
mmetsp:Transcript_2764/g.11273  ORF Transcript_2764/g.11273 Transcript_2764/m.11273 type:complete len:273 (-) Transcript_2764:863-1681(-)